jgi:hypothetical protein
MMILFKRLIKNLVLTAVIGFVIRKLMASQNESVSNFGHRTNRMLGGVFGLDERGRRAPRRGRAVTKSAGSAAIGGILSYFFDPQQGADRRARAKTFASERMHRSNGHTPQALPAGRYEVGPPARQTTTPGPAF